jgi:hypothetical protein
LDGRGRRVHGNAADAVVCALLFPVPREVGIRSE